MTEAVTKLNLRDTTAMRIERCLRAMTDVVSDADIPNDVRKEIAWAHAALHRCRDTRTVASMEHEQGLTPGGDAA